MRTFCSTSSTVIPSERICATMRNTSRTISGASPCDGSSSMSSFGLSRSARPIDSISCSPPESCRARPHQRHHQVLLDGEIGENLAAFGNIADAKSGDTKWRHARGLGAEDRDLALARRREPPEAAQRRGLAGAVAAEQRRPLALGGFKAHAMQDVALAVKRMKPLGGQRGGHAAWPK